MVNVPYLNASEKYDGVFGLQTIYKNFSSGPRNQMDPVNFPGFLEGYSILGNQGQLAEVKRRVRSCQIFSLVNFWMGEVGQVVRFINPRVQ